MQREALEGANTNTAVLQTMKNAADALKAAHQHMYVILIDHSLLP
jgi:charged multivesicular body protein 4